MNKLNVLKDACLCRKCERTLMHKFEKCSPIQIIKQFKTEDKCLLHLFDMCKDNDRRVNSITMKDIVQCYKFNHEPTDNVVLCDKHCKK